jgi:predicted Zn-dependent protease
VARAPALAGALACLLLVTACATRLPPIGGGPFTPQPQERALWARAERESAILLQAVRAYDEPALHNYLAGMVERLTPETLGLTGGPAWRVQVLHDPTLAAFAMPDGRLFVHSGLLAALASEAQLALVLARAVAQVTHRHALDALGDGRAARPPYAGAARLSPTAAVIHGRGLTLAASAALDGFPRRLERQADAVGLALLARAGWDAGEAATLWERLERARDAHDPLEIFLFGRRAWLDERRTSTRRLLDDADPGVERGAPVPTGEFVDRLRAVVRENALEDLRQGRFARARLGLDRVLAGAPDDALAHVYDGDLHRLQAQRASAAQDRGGLLDLAQARYLRAIALDPTLAEPHRQLGLLHYERRELAQARAELAAYLALARGAPDARRIAEYVRELER